MQLEMGLQHFVTTFSLLLLALVCFTKAQDAVDKGHADLNCTELVANATKQVEKFSCSRNDGSYSLTLSSMDEHGIFLHFKTLMLSEGDNFVLKTPKNVVVLDLTGEQQKSDLNFYIDSPIVILLATLSDKDKKQRSFIGHFYTGCTANVSGGLFEFPKYIVTNKTLTCNFTIMSHSIPESLPYVSFGEFNLDKKSFVTVNGLGPDFKEAPVFRGGTEPEFDLIGSGLTLSATLDTSVAGQSASILVSYVSKACSGMKVLTSQSPQQHLELPDDRAKLLFKEVDCRWVFVGQENTVLGLDVHNLSFTGVQDVLTATDGGRRNSPLAAQSSQSDSGRVSSLVTRTSSKYMWVSLSLTEFSANDSFRATVGLYEQGGHFSNNGTLAIKPTGDSSFLLEVEEGKLVWLEAPKSVIEQGSIEVRSDFYADSPLLETFAAGKPAYGVVSTGNKMLIQAKGFKGTNAFPVNFTGILPGCHLTTLAASGFYTLAGNCNSNCSWAVKPPSAKGAGKFTLTLDHLSLCTNDSLTVRTLTAAKLLLVVNGSAVPPVEMESEGGALLQVHRGACTRGNGTLVSASVSPVLGGTMTPELSHNVPYYLKSPGFPNQYPLNSNRTWTFEGKGVGGLVLSFSSLDLRAGHSLYLTSANQTVPLSGDKPPNDLALDNAKLTVRFASPITSGYESGYGFNATLLPVDMARMVDQEKGIVETPAYPSPVKNDSVFFWSISVPNPDKSKSAVAIQFNISLGKNASTTVQDISEFLTVYDGKNSFHSPIFANLTGKDLLSKTDVILVKYVVPASMPSGTPLRINFTTYVCNLTDTCKSTGICIHADWRCNGVNDCGDNSDELSCSYEPTPSPPPAPTTPAPEPARAGVSAAAFAVTVLIALALGAAAALFIPVLVRRYRAYRYSRFSNVAVSE